MTSHRYQHRAETFVRFVVGKDGQQAHRLDGLFTESGRLRDSGCLEPYQADWLDQIFTWFNAELPCPPFRRDRIPVNGICWYRGSATRFISRMWDLAALLRDHGIPVRLLKTEDPGSILYEDPYQVVAFRRRWCRKRR